MTVAMRHQYIDVQGMRTHYVVAGEGPPVILVHGLGASIVAWRETIDPLSQGNTVYAMDIPGHGDSDKPVIAYTSRAGVEFVGHFMDALDISRAALVGNSMGGLLSLGFTLDQPHRVTRLVLVDAAGLGRRLPLFMRLASLPLVGSLILRFTLGNDRILLRQVFYDRRFATDGLLQELARVRASVGAKRAELSAIRNGVNLWGERPHDILVERLPELKMPLLIVWGAQDRIIPQAHARDAARRAPEAQVAILPQCGHWPQIEKSQEFNSLVREFLEQDGDVE